jgi:hypothetical protein
MTTLHLHLQFKSCVATYSRFSGGKASSNCRSLYFECQRSRVDCSGIAGDKVLESNEGALTNTF